MKYLIYCTMAKPYLYNDKLLKQCFVTDNKLNDIYDSKLNGKIVAEFECDRADEFEFGTMSRDIFSYWYQNGHEVDYDKMCLTYDDLWKKIGSGIGYAIHIKNLKVFDEPMKPNQFKVRWREQDKQTKELFGDNAIAFKWLEKAPQNMCKVYRLNANGEDYDEYFLISIRPEWVCKILNGEKTIEVRKKVLKGML